MAIYWLLSLVVVLTMSLLDNKWQRQRDAEKYLNRIRGFNK